MTGRVSGRRAPSRPPRGPAGRGPGGPAGRGPGRGAPCPIAALLIPFIVLLVAARALAGLVCGRSGS